MSFEYPFLLILALVPLAWGFYEWRHTARHLALTLKVAALVLVALALAQPRLQVPESKVAAVVLVDTSASIPESDLEAAANWARQVQRAQGRNWVRVIPFARSSRVLSAAEMATGARFQTTGGELGRGTDLEAAVREAIAAVPAGMIPRVVLMSDGHENNGSIARAAWLAQELQVPIDTVSLSGRPRPNLRVESIVLPSVAFTGEKFPIDLVVSSPSKASGSVEIQAEGKRIGTSPIEVVAGNNSVRVHAVLNTEGAVDLSLLLKAEGMGEVRLQQAITLRKPRILYISADPAGTETHFLETLQAARFDVQRMADPTKGKLDDFQIVVLNNQDLEAIPAPRKAQFEEYVKQGGGLLVIGGERNVYLEGKKEEDALDRTLPAKLAPPRSPEGTAVVLIMDKSSSMEGRKMELARLAAIGVIENLRPIDSVGVLIFDNSFQWAVPIRKAEDRSLIKRLVAGITPDGGTQIAPALSEAARRMVPVTATFKHVVLLTDGISEEGDSLMVAKEAGNQRVTISTVGLGQDVNRTYLEKVAQFAKGKSYFLVDPSGLEQILLKDVMEHTGSTAVEKPITPIVVRQSDLINGVPMDTAPALKGYVKFIAKPSADTILKVDKDDPLLSVWQLGLGRSAVFTSDAKSRWAEKWVSWPGYDRFWVNVMRSLLPHTQASETAAEYDITTGDLVVNYRLARFVQEPTKVPEIFVLGPENFRAPLPLSKTGDGSFTGRLHIGSRQGLFRIRPLEDSKLFPETGLYRIEEELTQYGSNESLLKQVSRFTGGRFRPTPAQVFDSSGRSMLTTMQLWPGLLAAAIVLSLIELILRKWSGVSSLFGANKAA
jgi:Ca-activated chloride channel homolog